MTTYPLDTLAPTITENGITAPSYDDIFASLQASFRSIYGNDSYLDPDSQDGQMLGIIAKAVNDTNNRAIDVYNSFSPATGQGNALSSNVKINGLLRQSATSSTVPVEIVGQAGTTILNGLVGDNLNLGTKWALPDSVVIPIGGSIVVTATCTTAGDAQAPADSLTNILTPTFGWQSVNNPSAATAGNPIETDAQLRIRQSESTALPSLSPIDSILSNVANLPGVGRHAIYENSTGSTDANGVPSHSVSVVVEGGDLQQIANTIAATKPPGCGTYGTTTEEVVDPAGVTSEINFFILTEKRIIVAATISALPGFLASTEDAIKQAIADYINGLPVGGKIYLNKTITAASLNNSALAMTFNVAALTQSIFPASPTAADIAIAFNAAAQCAVADITLDVV